MRKKRWKTTTFLCFDIENAILTGEIVERQKDVETSEWKYLVGGKTLDEEDIIIAGKLSATDKLVIITVYREDFENYENKDNEITCDMCGKTGARILHVSKSYGQGADLLVIENVPVISCPHCGESYLTAQTLREIENIKRNRANFATERSVPVTVFV